MPQKVHKIQLFFLVQQEMSKLNMKLGSILI